MSEHVEQAVNVQEIQTQLLAERERLESQLERRSDQSQGNEDNRSRGDLASDYFMQERQHALSSVETQKLAQINGALERIDEGTYGHCTRCDAPIAAERLEILPSATLCMDCQRNESAK